MRPASPQQTLFEMHPVGTEPPIADRKITPGCLLPIAPNLVVDIKRAAEILDVSEPTILKLRQLGCIDGYQLTGTRRWNIAYQSIVDFCDRLRIEHALHDRRAKLLPGRRWTDKEILPFPKEDTVSVEDAMRGLDQAKDATLKLIEEGAFEAYRLHPNSSWRISKTSLFAYRDRLKEQLSQPRFAGRPGRRQPRR